MTRVLLHDGAVLALAASALLLAGGGSRSGLEMARGRVVAAVAVAVKLGIGGLLAGSRDGGRVVAGGGGGGSGRGGRRDWGGDGCGGGVGGGGGGRGGGLGGLRDAGLERSALLGAYAGVVGGGGGEDGVESLGGQRWVLAGLQHHVGDVCEELDPSVFELGGEVVLDAVGEGSEESVANELVMGHFDTNDARVALAEGDEDLADTGEVVELGDDEGQDAGHGGGLGLDGGEEHGELWVLTEQVLVELLAKEGRGGADVCLFLGALELIVAHGRPGFADLADFPSGEGDVEVRVLFKRLPGLAGCGMRLGVGGDGRGGDGSHGRLGCWRRSGKGRGRKTGAGGGLDWYLYGQAEDAATEQVEKAQKNEKREGATGVVGRKCQGVRVSCVSCVRQRRLHALAPHGRVHWRSKETFQVGIFG